MNRLSDGVINGKETSKHFATRLQTSSLFSASAKKHRQYLLRILLLFSNKICQVFSWATSQVYRKLLPMSDVIILIW